MPPVFALSALLLTTRVQAAGSLPIAVRILASSGAGGFQIPGFYVDEVYAVVELFLNADGGVEDGAADGAGAEHGGAPYDYEGFLLLQSLDDGEVVHVVRGIAGFDLVDAVNVVDGEVSGGGNDFADAGSDGFR